MMFQVIPAGALWTLPRDNNLYAPFDTHKVGPKYDFNFAGMHGVSVPVAPVPPHPLAYPVLPSARAHATDCTRSLRARSVFRPWHCALQRGRGLPLHAR